MFRRWLRRTLLALAVLALVLVGAGVYLVHHQGVPPEDWAHFQGATVRFDPRGIPTIEAADWRQVIEAEGFVVASERLFQMDLMRRSGAGRLAAWFGAAALERDRTRVREDWDGVAARAYADAPPDEKAYLDAYAAGVNRFIREYPGRAGLEYSLLHVAPEAWSGKDSLLILLDMAEQLSASADADAAVGSAAPRLGPEWSAFIFPADHPWNAPLFGGKSAAGPPLPWSRALPMTPIAPGELARSALASSQLEGRPRPRSAGVLAARVRGSTGPLPASNEWAWCGATGCFLANDPHLGHTVPGIWYAVRLRVSAQDWAVGVAIPGLPGIVLGMNPHLAWGFTNVGEDVDDLLEEKVSDDHQRYLAAVDGGQEDWRPIQRETRRIPVRFGDDAEVTVLATHRGPLAELAGKWYSRQWLPLRPGRLHLPIDQMRAASWEALNAALDRMTVPAQNVIAVDRAGNLGYRASGTGVIRRVSGRTPAPALAGEWGGFEPPATRPRFLIRVAGQPTQRTGEGPLARSATTAPDAPRSLSTANERNWISPLGDGWTDDLRAERIRRFLRARADLRGDDMRRLQLDTESRYYRLLLDWVRGHATLDSSAARALVAAWAGWDGTGSADPQVFTDAITIDRALTRVCTRRLARAFLPDDQQGVEIRRGMRTAWLIAMLSAPGGPGVFGLDEGELANRLLEVALARRHDDPAPYTERNHWAAQHPFHALLPLLGRLFAVDTPPQVGWRGVVRVEQPDFGASVRMIWDLRSPLESRWTLPVGQSGHLGSPHYRDLQGSWFAAEYYPVLDVDTDWGLKGSSTSSSAPHTSTGSGDGG